MSLPTLCSRFPIRSLGRAVAGLAASVATLSVWAAGGPPMVTDDPETPGSGRWEINVAVVSSRASGQRELAIPDVDLNYGLGERIQLKLDIPWVRLSVPGQQSHHGLGDADAGVKWRFYDDEESGVSISTYPQYTHALTGASIAHGTASSGHQFFLPVEGAAAVAGVGLVGEVGRNFIQGQKGQWVAGGVATHACGDGNECMLEVRRTQGASQHETLFNAGLHRKLDESVALLVAAGTERGTRSDERRQSLVYFGLQFTQ